VNASDGIASVTIGGVGFTLQQLQALNGMQTVDTTEGVLKLNSFSGDKFGGSVNYTYTVKAAIDNDTRGDAAGTYFDDSVTIAVEGIGGTAATDSLVIRIRDDAPRAFSAANSGQSTALPTNLMLVLDISGSMNDPSGVAGLSRLALMKQSVNKLIDDYDAFGDVMVNIVTFSSQASNPQPNWQAATEAKGFVNGLVASGTTNYDDALNTAWNAFKNDGGRQLGGQNILYFLSDGVPNVNGVPLGALASPTYGTGDNNLGGGNGIDGDEEADWQGFLKNFEIKSYAIGLGTGAVARQLDPIAFDGTAVGTNTNAIVVTDLKDLDATLATTITAPPLAGTLLDGTTATTGADGG